MRGDGAERPTVLVVDDERGIRDAFAETIGDLGYRVVTAEDAEEAEKKVLAEPVCMAFVDIWMPTGMDGVELLKRWRQKGLLSFPVVMVSGVAKVSDTVEAMRNGAADVLTKPVSREQIKEKVDRLADSGNKDPFDHAVRSLDMGVSPAMLRVKGELLKVASTLRPVTVVGGAGDGCEHFALLLHQIGKPWLTVDDARMLEHNPATRLPEMRNGTIYVRSLGELDDKQQRGLDLLVRNAGRHGVRMACESRAPVGQLADDGKLDKALAQALQMGQIKVPPLAEYVDDLVNMLMLIVQRLGALGVAKARFDRDAMELLVSGGAGWDELGLGATVLIVRSLLAASPDGAVDAEQVKRLMPMLGAPQPALGDDIYELPFRESRREFEKEYFRRVLIHLDNNYGEAAKFAGLERTYFYKRVRTLLDVTPGDGK